MLETSDFPSPNQKLQRQMYAQAASDLESPSAYCTEYRVSLHIRRSLSIPCASEASAAPGARSGRRHPGACRGAHTRTAGGTRRRSRTCEGPFQSRLRMPLCSKSNGAGSPSSETIGMRSETLSPRSATMELPLERPEGSVNEPRGVWHRFFAPPSRRLIPAFQPVARGRVALADVTAAEAVLAVALLRAPPPAMSGRQPALVATANPSHDER